jgi:hypothetical protein
MDQNRYCFVIMNYSHIVDGAFLVLLVATSVWLGCVRAWSIGRIILLVAYAVLFWIGITACLTLFVFDCPP